MIEKASHSRIKIIFLFATIFLIALSILSYVRIKNLVEASDLVNNTNLVNLRLEKIITVVIDAETNQKSYLITGNSAVLSKRDAAINTLTHELSLVDSLTKDNPNQIENLKILKTEIKLKLLSMGKVMLLYKPLVKTPEFILNVTDGIRLTENIKKRINKMQSEEDKILKVRTTSFSESAIATPLLTILLILGSIIILIAAYLKILQELKMSDKLKSEIASKELRINTILEYAPDAVITIDENGIIMSWNPQAQSIFGWRKDEVLGKTLTETIIPERYREQHKSGIKHYLKTGEGPVIDKPIEIFALNKNKNEFPIELKISSSKINERYIFIGFARDISVRKQIAEALKSKTNQLVEAQQLANIGSWEWDVPANKIEWSDELYRIYGLVPQEFEADYENFLKYIHPDDRDYVNGIVQQAFKDQKPFSFYHKVIYPDGTERVVSSTGKVFTDSKGNTIRMAGTAQDVTKQKKYEAELKESEERFSKIFDYNPVPMTLSEIKTNKIKYANKLFYAAFGYTEEEVIGHTSEELNLIGKEENQKIIARIFGYLQQTRTLAEVQSVSVEESEELLIKLKQTEAMKNLEILYTRKNGETFPAVVSFEIIGFGTQRYTITSYQDITERKKAQELLTNQNENLLKANKELESFNYISSHDLQEPLRKIQTFATRIVEKEYNSLTDSAKDYFNRMHEAAHRMQTLIADLLAYSRTTSAERKYETTDLNKIINDVKEDLKEDLIEKHATIEATELCDVDIIPFQFRQLMHNLIGNSLKFSNPNNPPHIKIKSKIEEGVKLNNEKLSPEKKYCHISISDNGIGFDPQYKERIFEVFQRFHDKQKITGTGIGLAIAKKIVENHSGIITASGELNKGATFDIYIPVT